MSGWDIAPALALAQLQATLDRLGAAPGPAAVLIYTTPQPDAAAPLVIEPDHQASLPLASPPGGIVAGVLKLAPAAGSTPVVLAGGVPRWGLLVAGDGVPLARGDVTNDTGTGAIRITGGTTAGGETSPTLYPGGLVGLAETFLT
jgi:hypothetical protein